METLTMPKSVTKINALFNRETRENYFEMLEVAQKNLLIVDNKRRYRKVINRISQIGGN